MHQRDRRTDGRTPGDSKDRAYAWRRAVIKSLPPGTCCKDWLVPRRVCLPRQLQTAVASMSPERFVQSSALLPTAELCIPSCSMACRYRNWCIRSSLLKLHRIRCGSTVRTLKQQVSTHERNSHAAETIPPKADTKSNWNVSAHSVERMFSIKYPSFARSYYRSLTKPDIIM